MILWVRNCLFIMSSLLTLKNNLSSQRFTCKYHTCRCTRWHAGAQTVCKLNPQWQTCTCTPPQQHTSLSVLPDMSASLHGGELNRSKDTIHSHFSVHHITNNTYNTADIVCLLSAIKSWKVFPHAGHYSFNCWLRDSAILCFKIPPPHFTPSWVSWVSYLSVRIVSVGFYET